MQTTSNSILERQNNFLERQAKVLENNQGNIVSLIEKFSSNNNIEQLIRNTVQQETVNIQNQLSNLTKPLIQQVEKISSL